MARLKGRGKMARRSWCCRVLVLVLALTAPLPNTAPAASSSFSTEGVSALHGQGCTKENHCALRARHAPFLSAARPPGLRSLPADSSRHRATNDWRPVRAHAARLHPSQQLPSTSGAGRVLASAPHAAQDAMQAPPSASSLVALAWDQQAYSYWEASNLCNAYGASLASLQGGGATAFSGANTSVR